VGNGAVQEVIAARQFYGAQLAAVVCKSNYTRSARQLAAAARVHLLHTDELPNIDDIVKRDAVA
jgi:restriction system protein